MVEHLPEALLVIQEGQVEILLERDGRTTRVRVAGEGELAALRDGVAVDDGDDGSREPSDGGNPIAVALPVAGSLDANTEVWPGSLDHDQQARGGCRGHDVANAESVSCCVQYPSYC